MLLRHNTARHRQCSCSFPKIFTIGQHHHQHQSVSASASVSVSISQCQHQSVSASVSFTVQVRMPNRSDSVTHLEVFSRELEGSVLEVYVESRRICGSRSSTIRCCQIVNAIDIDSALGGAQDRTGQAVRQDSAELQSGSPPSMNPKSMCTMWPSPSMRMFALWRSFT